MPPALTIIGDVVKLRPKLNWFENLPLFGKKIVVTRRTGQAGKFAAQLKACAAADDPVLAETAKWALKRINGS